jgi:hypothetical protein
MLPRRQRGPRVRPGRRAVLGATRTALVVRAVAFALLLGAFAPTARATLTPGEENARIDAIRNRIDAQGLAWTAGHTSVSGLSLEELRTRLGLTIPDGYIDAIRAAKDNTGDLGAPGDAAGEILPLAAPAPTQFPPVWDWRALGGVTPVRNQDACGSCWAFSATAAFESAILIHEEADRDLSEQQVILCNPYGYGCDGGWMGRAYDFFVAAGAAREECVPYVAGDGDPCPDGRCFERDYLAGHHSVKSTIRDLKAALLNGPLAVAMTVHEDFLCYTGGCYSSPESGTPNHGILIVGWDDTTCDGAGAWIVKNSWGPSWGAGGYGYIRYHSCEIGFGAEQVDYTPPTGIEILHAPIDDPPRSVDPLEVRAIVRSHGGALRNGFPRVHYRFDGSALDAITLRPTGNADEFAAILPGLPSGTTVEYYLSAEDDLGHAQTSPLRAPAQVHRFTTGWMTVWSADGETNNEGWTHGALAPAGVDPWHRSALRNHTPGGARAWKCGATGNTDYADRMNAGLQTPWIELPPDAQLRFFHWIDAENSAFHMGWAYDGGIVEISPDGGTTWEALQPLAGYPYLTRIGSSPGAFPAGTPLFSGMDGWREERFDLSGHSGSAMLRFRFASDGSIGFEGWYIDDVRVLGFAPGDPSPVVLLRLDALWESDAVTLEWQVADPSSFLGFRVDRGPTREGPFECRTPAMIGADAPESPGAPGETHEGYRFVDAAPQDEESVVYRLVGIARDGGSQELGFVAAEPMGGRALLRPRLLAPLPNPFGEFTQLRFRLPAALAGAPVELTVHDLQGRCVAVPQPSIPARAGEHWVAWEARDAKGAPLPSGAYYVRLRAGGFVVSERVARVR